MSFAVVAVMPDGPRVTAVAGTVAEALAMAAGYASEACAMGGAWSITVSDRDTGRIVASAGA